MWARGRAGGAGVGGWGGREAAIKAPGEAPVAVETPSVPEPSGSQVMVFQDVTIRGNQVIIHMGSVCVISYCYMQIYHFSLSVKNRLKNHNKQGPTV